MINNMSHIGLSRPYAQCGTFGKAQILKLSVSASSSDPHPAFLFRAFKGFRPSEAVSAGRDYFGRQRLFRPTGAV